MTGKAITGCDGDNPRYDANTNQPGQSPPLPDSNAATHTGDLKVDVVKKTCCSAKVSSVESNHNTNPNLKGTCSKVAKAQSSSCCPPRSDVFQTAACREAPVSLEGDTNNNMPSVPVAPAGPVKPISCCKSKGRTVKQAVVDQEDVVVGPSKVESDVKTASVCEKPSTPLPSIKRQCCSTTVQPAAASSQNVSTRGQYTTTIVANNSSKCCAPVQGARDASDEPASKRSCCSSKKGNNGERQACCPPKACEGVFKQSNATTIEGCEAPKAKCCSKASVDTIRCTTTAPINSHDEKDAGDDEDDDDDDATVCDCCITVLLKDTKNTVNLSSLPQRMDPSPAGIFESRLRRCCRVLRAYATHRKACCFVADQGEEKAKRRRLRCTENASKENLSEEKDKNKLEESPEATKGHEKLRLLVGGMDCPDCAPNVTRALSQLPSVKPQGLDYFGGTADLSFDPDILHPDAIARYVARATGFTVEATSNEVHVGTDTMSLPYTFSKEVSQKIIERYTVAKRKDPKDSHDVMFAFRGQNAMLPRKVHEDNLRHGGRLLSASECEGKDIVSLDAQRVTLRCLVSMALCIPTLVFAWANLPGDETRWMASALALSTLIIINAWPLMSSSLRSLVYLRRADLLLLVTISVMVSFVFSAVSFGLSEAGTYAPEPFFETTALLVTLIYCGRTVQAITRRVVASSANALRKIQSRTALLSSADGGGDQKGEETLDARLIHLGDDLIVRPGMLFPTDGVVVSGSGGVDESSFTGESVPVLKTEGSSVTAGTKNLDAILIIQATHLLAENSLSRMTQTIFAAQSSRSRFQDLSDRLAAIILPVAAISAALALLIWPLVERFVRSSSPASSGIAGLEYAIAIIVVSCPCALGLAVPLVSSIGMRIGLKEGLLFRSSEALHRSRGVTLFAFDKTGTLSTGKLSIQQVDVFWAGAEKLAAALTRDSQHPIAKAVSLATASEQPLTLDDLTNVPGSGVQGMYQGFPVRGGSAYFCGCEDDEAIRRCGAAGLSVFAVTVGHRLVAVYGLLDAPRKETRSLISYLQNRGAKVAIISGDNEASVRRFADLVDLPQDTVSAGCSPQRKAGIVETYQKEGHKVCFIGDGVNDSIAFAAADVSFSLVSGSEIAATTSDVLLFGSDLHLNIRKAVSLAEITYRHSIASLVWCSLYAVLAIILASGITVRFHIEPRWAGLGEVVSVVPVILIGLSMFITWSLRKRRSGLVNVSA